MGAAGRPGRLHAARLACAAVIAAAITLLAVRAVGEEGP
jgi:hypothetical protein